MKLCHVNLPARDPAGLARWYAGTFDLEVEGEFVYAPGVLLVFERGSPLGAPGNSHFGFAVDSAAEVSRWADRLAPHVAPLEVRAGFAAFKAADPEGNVFEIFWEPRPFPAAGVALREFAAGDRAWLEEVSAPVGGTAVVSRGRRWRLQDLPGVVALQRDRRAGFAFWRIDGRTCELVAIAAEPPGRGVGTALLEHVVATARDAGCARLWLVTTNDNLDALRFYQRRGLHLSAVYRGALVHTRALKPELPAIGDDGIPLRDEIELDLALAPSGR
jgi:GNAT superfamily N-acetyltransferase